VKRNIAALQGQHFDLLICGGGIYGAWTAYDAALRGLKVALVEQGDWASATSSASSKLIHGGLRYLESYDFKLVKKALTERQMLLRVAPHRVWPLRFGVPVYADSRIGRWQLKAGLMIYDFLAGTALRKMAHRYFTRQSFGSRFPALDNMGLKGGFTYGDAQTDDARLVLELIDGALQAGAVCVNYCKLTELLEQHGHATGALVMDQLSEQIITIQARQIVYATGQWSATEAVSSKWCRVTKGVHLLLPPLHTDEALLLTAKADGRVFFVIPWYGLTLLGTTDTDYSGDMQQVKVEEQDIAYLLDALNHYLKTALSKTDIIGSYAGLRVMKRSDNASPSAVSRDWELKTADNGVHYSIGGKITSSREDAAVIVDRICTELGLDRSCATKDRMFPWAPTMDYASWQAGISAQALKLGIDAQSTKWLLRRHGKRINIILKAVENNPELAHRITPSVPLIFADLLFCASDEMVVHLDDLLRRRMPLFILNKISIEVLRSVALRVSAEVGWDEARVEQEVARCTQFVAA
jgi:glycerol-3-phosphate dehydrogenase